MRRRGDDELAVRVSAVDTVLYVVYLLATVVRPVVGIVVSLTDVMATDGNVVLISEKREGRRDVSYRWKSARGLFL